MIVLDTNVLSELARRDPSRLVVEWVDDQDSADLVITAVTAAEIRAGIALLPDGRRRRDIAQRMEALIAETFAGQVLPFDVDCSPHYANILAARSRTGLPIAGLDAQIAAVCANQGAALATRNTADFRRTGVRLINPWERPVSPFESD
jgi:predicted nucleic acid-binding protein